MPMILRHPREASPPPAKKRKTRAGAGAAAAAEEFPNLTVPEAVLWSFFLFFWGGMCFIQFFRVGLFFFGGTMAKCRIRSV